MTTSDRYGILKFIICLLSVVVISGCASFKMPESTATPTTLEKLRVSNLETTNVGTFEISPKLDPSKDLSLGGLRGSSLKPEKGSFSKQLKDVIVTELQAAGLFDPAANIKIEGQLTESQVDAAIKTGTASLGAFFRVTKVGEVVYEKELRVESEWPSSFMGAIAIPKAINQYSALYKVLAAKLFEDPEFRSALGG